MKPFLLSTVVAAAAIHPLSAATLSLSLAQSGVGATGSTVVNLTTTGTMDWKVWTGDTGTSLIPNRAMSGGSGITSLATVGSVTNEPANYPNTEFRFDFTNGTSPNTTNSSVLPADRIRTDVNGEGTLMTITLPAAGTYKLTYYTTTFGISLQSVATLANGVTPLTQTANGTVPSGLQDYVWTVDFTTDAADTLTLRTTRSGGTGDIFAIGAATLVPEPSAALLGSFGLLALLRRRR